MTYIKKVYEPRNCEICDIEYMPKLHNQRTCGAFKCQDALARRARAQWSKDNLEKGRRSAAKQRANRKTAGLRPGRDKKAIRVDGIKGTTPCMDCKTIYPAECMDFDHRPGTEKIACVGTMVAHGWAWEKIEAEIAKCDLVCSNCHRIRTKRRSK